MVGIKVATAKSILHIYKKEGRMVKKINNATPLSPEQPSIKHSPLPIVPNTTQMALSLQNLLPLPTFPSLFQQITSPYTTSPLLSLGLLSSNASIPPLTPPIFTQHSFHTQFQALQSQYPSVYHPNIFKFPLVNL